MTKPLQSPLFLQQTHNFYLQEFKDSYTFSDKIKENPDLLYSHITDFCNPYSYKYDPHKCGKSLGLVRNSIREATTKTIQNSAKTKILNLDLRAWWKCFWSKKCDEMMVEIDLQEPFHK